MGLKEDECNEAFVDALNPGMNCATEHKMDIFIQQTLIKCLLCLGARNKRHNWYRIDS